MTEKVMGFAARCKDFFGLEGRSLQEFAAELRALTSDDKRELHGLFNAAGLPTAEPHSFAQPKE